jgi:hypothetical protein
LFYFHTLVKGKTKAAFYPVEAAVVQSFNQRTKTGTAVIFPVLIFLWLFCAGKARQMLKRDKKHKYHNSRLLGSRLKKVANSLNKL